MGEVYKSWTKKVVSGQTDSSVLKIEYAILNATSLTWGLPSPGLCSWDEGRWDEGKDMLCGKVGASLHRKWRHKMTRLFYFILFHFMLFYLINYGMTGRTCRKCFLEIERAGGWALLALFIGFPLGDSVYILLIELLLKGCIRALSVLLSHSFSRYDNCHE